MHAKDQQNFFDPFVTATKLSTLTSPSPYPYFGGKSQIASEIWARFGNVQGYIEPFFGGGSVLLKAPKPATMELINDLDCYVANFGRAIKRDPEGVEYYAREPIIEVDLWAKNLWLANNRANYQEILTQDPEFFDSKVAGWWVYCMCLWVGDGVGISRSQQRFSFIPMGMLSRTQGNPQKSVVLAERIKNTKVLCGDWQRALTKGNYYNFLPCGIFLDPPYDTKLCSKIYANNDPISPIVRNWAIENGANLDLRICLAGYKEEHDQFIPANWERVHWKANGGFGNQGKGRAKKNKEKETLWFSPGCLKSHQRSLFDE